MTRRHLTAMSMTCVVLSVVALSGCSGEERSTVDVELRLNTCDAQRENCSAAGLSGAEISLVDGGGTVIASGTSDEAGEVVLATSGARGEATVVAVSPLIEGGRKESHVVLPSNGGATDITMMANDSRS